jgi:ATP-dependent RNA helicase DDX23/PRP28
LFAEASHLAPSPSQKKALCCWIDVFDVYFIRIVKAQMKSSENDDNVNPIGGENGYDEEDHDDDAPLIDPHLLTGLSESERKEALAAAAAARRAEERAERRALERLINQREEERRREREVEAMMLQQRQKRPPPLMGLNLSSSQSSLTALASVSSTAEASPQSPSLVYVPKRRRIVAQGQQQELQQDLTNTCLEEPQPVSNGGGGVGVFRAARDDRSDNVEELRMRTPRRDEAIDRGHDATDSHPTVLLSEKEAAYVRRTYLGSSAFSASVTNPAVEFKPSRQQQDRGKKKKVTFKFRWDNTDDTAADDDPLYESIGAVAAASSSKNAIGNSSNSRHHQYHGNRPSSSNDRTTHNRRQRTTTAAESRSSLEDSMDSINTKPWNEITPRDCRILRENYEIYVRGGKAPPPLRHFRDSHPVPLHPLLLQAIEQDLRFREPTPIQRQAIPIGLQRRDLIGLAETGSGKTIAFGVPLCHYLLNLPTSVLQSVSHNGPLALVLAPTRELALQIEVELGKLLTRCRHLVQSVAVVGGQSIQQQSQQLRRGVHIVVGTPGRLNEVLELAYLVLNQCSYVVLDEADRMLDMGFAPQITTILDAMGANLKSEVEDEAYRQELEDLQNASSSLSSRGVARHRVTAMFSATMPMDVQTMAQKYLRHPAIVSIGDPSALKRNTRIKQKLVWTIPAQKEKVLINLLSDPRFVREKVLVFVNEKKHADGVGRVVERSGRDVVVMHGGKSQEQREDHLERFRRGGVVMVATDVVGRGLDIPDVAHVINYDLPTRSIENYTHRIGRTGRAGKQGLATSIITDEDEGIMAALRQYLESTGNEIPDRLARHPAAASVSGDMGNLID